MQAKCVWVESSWDGMIPGLQAKKFDAIASSMTITPQRRQQIAFSSKVSNAPARLVAHKGSNLQPTVASLKGKSVGVQQGSSRGLRQCAVAPGRRQRGRLPKPTGGE